MPPPSHNASHTAVTTHQYKNDTDKFFLKVYKEKKISQIILDIVRKRIKTSDPVK